MGRFVIISRCLFGLAFNISLTDKIGHNMRYLTLIFFLAFSCVTFLPADSSARGAPESFADLAERLAPAVVNISTTQTVDRTSSRERMPEQFREFFEEFMDRMPHDGPRTPQKVSSLGSGFVIHPQGIVVTNNHVIEDADEIVVNFSNGEKFDAKIIGRDPKTDLAVLKIEGASGKKFPFVKFGNSQKSRVGDWVIAIGNPFGLGGSLSAGVISAINRDINAGPYDSFIQTDAAINRGNSGGPLFNLDGEVIGVNSAIISPSGGSVGIGFSIPSDLVQTVIAQLQEYGETRRGWLGVRIQQVTDDLAETLGLKNAQGALVSEVSKGGPAEKGGIEVGDVIVSFDGKDVTEMRDLPRIVAETKIDKRVAVMISRAGKEKKLFIVTGRLDESDVLAAADEQAPDDKSSDGPSVLGMSLVSLSDEERSRFNIPSEVTGALIRAVEPNSAAAQSGIRAGDVVTKIGQTAVKSVADARSSLEGAQKAGQSSVLLLLHNGSGLRFVALHFAGDKK